MADSSRIEDLRRRLREDPASIAFAQLAEEHRRLGEFQTAVDICRVGLARHPGYDSARVTLGRALMELGALDAAREAFEQVLSHAPDNLTALKALADLHSTIGTKTSRDHAERVIAGLGRWLHAVHGTRAH